MKDDDENSKSRDLRKKRTAKRKKKRSEKRERKDRHDDASSRTSSSDDRRHGKKRSRTKKSKKKEHKRPQKSDRREPKEQDLYNLGNVYGRVPDKTLTSADYFDFHKHLWLFLFRTKGLIFDELSSKETRKYFDDFCKKYNTGKLPAVYYEPKLPRQALDECPTTRHKWGFNVSKELELLHQNVYQQTEQDLNMSTASTKHDVKTELAKRPMVGPERPLHLSTKDETGETVSRKRSRFDRAGDREKPDFRECRLLEKKHTADRIHGAHRDRDAVELTDDAVYGGGDSSDFRRALEQEKKRNAVREERQAARRQELMEKEAIKQKEMMERLGLAKR